jgi:hypothetical protein
VIETRRTSWNTFSIDGQVVWLVTFLADNLTFGQGRVTNLRTDFAVSVTSFTNSISHITIHSNWTGVNTVMFEEESVVVTSKTLRILWSVTS